MGQSILIEVRVITRIHLSLTSPFSPDTTPVSPPDSLHSPSCLQALHQPATSVLVLACCGIWYLLHRWGLGYPDVGMSFDAVVANHELWRMVTSQLSHVDLLHLVFNVSALWSVGIVERARGLGTVYYLQQSALMFVLSPLVSRRAGVALLTGPAWPCSPCPCTTCCSMLVGYMYSGFWVGSGRSTESASNKQP